MAAQSNPPASFGYTWGFADNSRSDGAQIVELSPNINYTVSDNVSFIQKKILFYFILFKKIELTKIRRNNKFGSVRNKNHKSKIVPFI